MKAFFETSLVKIGEIVVKYLWKMIAVSVRRINFLLRYYSYYNVTP